MARKKVEMKYVTDDSARKTSYKKRKRGLTKKIDELSTLCDVPACLIMYSQYDNNPEVWPNPLEARRVIADYKNMPEIEQTKRMVNQEAFLKQRVAKLTEKLRKLKRANDEKELSRDMFQCLVGRPLQGLSAVALSGMAALIERYERDIDAKLNKIMEGPAQGVLPMVPSQALPVASAKPVVAGENPNMINLDLQEAQRPPWFDVNMSKPQFRGDETLPFGNQSHNAFWSNNPFNHMP